MQSGTRFAGGLVLALIILSLSCEDSPFIAPEGSTITVSAVPVTVRLDLDEEEDTSEIRAQVVDDSGLPLDGASVFFSTTGGSLESGGAAIETDANGIARDVLTVTDVDDGTIEITARSGAATGDITVSVDVVGVNQLPIPSITASPVGRQGKGESVTFTGGTTDPDNPDDPVTCWCWGIDSDLVGVPTEIFVGTGSNSVSKPTGFPVEQNLDVILLVSDIPGVSCTQVACTDCVADPDSCEDQFSDLIIEYAIVCDTSNPIAEAGTAPSTVPVSTPVPLDGSGSTDQQSPIESYQWNCGSGGTANPPGASAQPTATCTYTTTGIKTITLTVTNECGLTDTETLSITVQ